GARFESGIRHPHDLVALALEDRNARRSAAIRAIAHIFRKRRSLVRDHGKLPATTVGETLLPLGRVRYKSRAIAQVLEHTIEAVGPHRAMRAGDAHIVDDE